MTIDNNEQQHLAQIRRYPDDDKPRIEYARWLAGQARPHQYDERRARAEFILCQLALEREGIQPTITPKDSSPYAIHPTKCSEQDFLQGHKAKWQDELSRRGASKIIFRRGFPDSFEISASDFVRNGKDIVAIEPLVRTVRIRNCKDTKTIEALATSPALAHITSLVLSDSKLTDEGVRILATSRHISQLTSLTFDGCVGLGSAAAMALGASPRLNNLSSLMMSGAHLGDDGVCALASSPYLKALSHLELGCNQITNKGARALANSKHLHNLAFCDLSGNSQIDPDALNEIARVVGPRRDAIRNNRAV